MGNLHSYFDQPRDKRFDDDFEDFDDEQEEFDEDEADLTTKMMTNTTMKKLKSLISTQKNNGLGASAPHSFVRRFIC
ncbi:MAG: hypothetical protein HC840_16920 [Leptolyngbyaceae cyanobacterium RM2_2_4]|nr:hypothetical protein [Leptolyngbyaceae cyanobacterium RM2_2_4]